jgi:hypothetical protein
MRSARRRPTFGQWLTAGAAISAVVAWTALTIALAVPSAARRAIGAAHWHAHAFEAQLRWWVSLVGDGTLGFAIALTLELVMMIVLIAAIVYWIDRRKAARRHTDDK